jgi:A49-like RNA polymerase I associated factor
MAKKERKSKKDKKNRKEKRDRKRRREEEEQQEAETPKEQPRPASQEPARKRARHDANAAAAATRAEETVRVTVSAKPLAVGQCPPFVGIFAQNPPAELLSRSGGGKASSADGDSLLQFTPYVHKDDKRWRDPRLRGGDGEGDDDDGDDDDGDDDEAHGEVPRHVIMCDRKDAAFVGGNWAASASASGSAGGDDGVDGAVSRVAVGLFNPETMRLTLVETSGLVSIQTRVKGLDVQSFEGDLDSLSTQERRAATIEDFGSQRAKTANRTFAANRIDLESTPLMAMGGEAGNTTVVQLNNDISEAQRAHLESFEAAGGAARQAQTDDLPRFDSETLDAHRCFPLEQFLDAEAAEMYATLGISDEVSECAFSGAAPLRKLGERLFAGDAATVAAFVQWCLRVADRTQASSSLSPCTGEEGFLAVLLACQLLHLHSTSQRRDRGRARALRLDERQFASDTSMPLALLKNVVRRTSSSLRIVRPKKEEAEAEGEKTTGKTETNSSSAPLLVSSLPGEEKPLADIRWSGAKLLLLQHFVLVLALHANGQRCPVDRVLLAALRWTDAEAREHFARLGCKIEAAGSAKFAVLRAPLRFPVIRKRGRRG